jgi:5'(3')-deoxyribonucleotidase
MRVKNFEQFLNEAKEQIKFFIDMDGVLADFDRAIEESPEYAKLDDHKKNLFDYIRKTYPEVDPILVDDAKPLLAKHSDDKELKELYDLAHDLIHKIAEQKGFFLNLKPMPGAKKLLEAAAEISGQLPTILTAPVKSPYSVDEKTQWMADNFPGMYDTVIADKDKGKHAIGKHGILVDDRDKYIEGFTKAGGSAIKYLNYKDAIQKMKNFRI